jgi:hypothetical protein
MTEMSEKGFGSTKEMMESYQNFIKQMPSNANWNQFMNYTNPLVEMYEKTFAPYAKLMSPEQNNMGEKMVEMMETFSKYSIKQTQLQYLLYQTSQKSMETAVENAYKNMSENKEVSNFNQFFNEWVSVTDKAFVELFGSDEFSALKSEVLSLSSHIKKEMEVSMEKSMEKMPFAFKSHLDELYKSIYDLKKMVKEMKKNLELEQENEKYQKLKTQLAEEYQKITLKESEINKKQMELNHSISTFGHLFKSDTLQIDIEEKETSYRWDLEKNFKVSGLKLINYSLPNIKYNIDEHNNYLMINNKKLLIENGFYDINQLLNEINSKQSQFKLSVKPSCKIEIQPLEENINMLNSLCWTRLSSNDNAISILEKNIDRIY